MVYKQAFLPEKYDNNIIQTMPYYEEYFRQITDIVNTFFNIPIAWLYIGCGTGKMAGIAAKNFYLKNLTCCDISRQMLRIAKERLNSVNVDFNKTSIQNLKNSSNFDVVTAILITHYLKYEERMVGIRNCYKALKKNGLFFTVENFAPDNDMIKSLYIQRWKNFQLSNGKDENECQKHILRYNTEYFPITINEQIHLLKKCGFENVEVFWCSYMQVGILGIK